MIVLAYQRYVASSRPTKIIIDITLKNYSIYKGIFIFFGPVNAVYSCIFEDPPLAGKVTGNTQWSTVLAEYVTENDKAMLKASEKVLAKYRDELLPCVSFEEYYNVIGKYSF